MALLVKYLLRLPESCQRSRRDPGTFQRPEPVPVCGAHCAPSADGAAAPTDWQLLVEAGPLLQANLLARGSLCSPASQPDTWGPLLSSVTVVSEGENSLSCLKAPPPDFVAETSMCLSVHRADAERRLLVNELWPGSHRAAPGLRPVPPSSGR